MLVWWNLKDRGLQNHEPTALRKKMCNASMPRRWLKKKKKTKQTNLNSPRVSKHLITTTKATAKQSTGRGYLEEQFKQSIFCTVGEFLHGSSISIHRIWFYACCKCQWTQA
jgi:hypothetical protein